MKPFPKQRFVESGALKLCEWLKYLIGDAVHLDFLITTLAQDIHVERSTTQILHGDLPSAGAKLQSCPAGNVQRGRLDLRTKSAATSMPPGRSTRNASRRNASRVEK